MRVHFTKMHGIGNDYIYIDCLERKLGNLGELSKKLSDRHFGIGGDGIILILPSKKADFKMRMFNSDGSEAQMCGNGIRCFAKYVYDKGRTDKKQISVETGNGVLTLDLLIKSKKVEKVRVDMGIPILEARKIPTLFAKDRIINEPFEISGKQFEITCVSMGNPHCVVFVDRITDEQVLTIGPQIEKNRLFPQRINVEFVAAIGKKEVDMRVWERGSGETLACGTGAGAVCVAGVLTGRTARKITVHLRGGDLELEWAKNNHVFLTGPATWIFEGEIEVDL